MFAAGSRYQRQVTYRVVHRGVPVSAVRPPLPTARAPIGFHPPTAGERLDLLAARYLADPTAFWQICDTNNTLAPASLAAEPLLAIPAKAS